MLSESALAVAAYRCPVGITPSPWSGRDRGPGPVGRGWGPGPVEGAGALGRVLLAGPTLPFPRLLETCGRQASLLGAVAGRLCGVFCESHCVFAHLPCLQQALLPGRVWPLCPCGCLSVCLSDCDVALEREGFQIGPLGLPRADGTAQVGQGPPGRARPTQLVSAPDRHEPSGADCRKGRFALAEASPDSPGELAHFLGALGAARILQRLPADPGSSCSRQLHG